MQGYCKLLTYAPKKKASPVIVPFYHLIPALEDTAEITLTFTFLNPPTLLDTAPAFSPGISSAFT